MKALLALTLALGGCATQYGGASALDDTQHEFCRFYTQDALCMNSVPTEAKRDGSGIELRSEQETRSIMPATKPRRGRKRG